MVPSSSSSSSSSSSNAESNTAGITGISIDTSAIPSNILSDDAPSSSTASLTPRTLLAHFPETAPTLTVSFENPDIKNATLELLSQKLNEAPNEHILQITAGNEYPTITIFVKVPEEKDTEWSPHENIQPALDFLKSAIPDYDFDKAVTEKLNRVVPPALTIAYRTKRPEAPDSISNQRDNKIQKSNSCVIC